MKRRYQYYHNVTGATWLNGKTEWFYVFASSLEEVKVLIVQKHSLIPLLGWTDWRMDTDMWIISKPESEVGRCEMFAFAEVGG